MNLPCCTPRKCLAQLIITVSTLLVGCTTPPPAPPIPKEQPPVGEVEDGYPEQPVDVTNVPDAVPRVEPRSRYGNPDSYEVFGERYHVIASSQGFSERGIASWYGTKFHGRRTSSGEPYDMYSMTAAHKTLPLPTYVRVTNLRNGRSTVVKVNDRGPFHDNRIIDLSYAAAYKLEILEKGTGLVEIEALDPPSEPGANAVLTQARAEPNVAIYIQVGAFGDRRNAIRLQEQLQALEHENTRIENSPEEVENPFYRVQIGPIADAEQADAIIRQLAAEGIETFRIVID
jgi:rare lipoprotein A